MRAPRGCISLSVLRGRGDGSFVSRQDLPASAWPRAITVADFNADGLHDVAVVSGSMDWADVPEVLSLFLGKGDGTFQARTDTPLGSDREPTSVTAADLDADGKQDVAVGFSSGESFRVLLGNGNGTFKPAVGSDSGYGPKSIAVADFNGDGQPELITHRSDGVKATWAAAR